MLKTILFLLVLLTYISVSVTVEDALAINEQQSSSGIQVDEQSIDIFLQGSVYNVRKGVQNLSVSLTAQIQVKNRVSRLLNYELFIRFPNDCYSSSYIDGGLTDYRTTINVTCRIPGPINENMTIDTDGYAWFTPIYERKNMNQFVSDKNSIQINVK